MATTQKLSETGWFYHAPGKKSEAVEPAPTPYASQIPGLNDLPPEPITDQHKHMMVNDFDSDYVRLAKQGGRSDLLRMRTPKPRSEEAVPYARVNWFYQSDIEVEEGDKDDKDGQEKMPHQFLLPDYMVHQSYDGPKATVQSPSPQSSGKRCIKQKQNPSPFATEANLQFQRSPVAGKEAPPKARRAASNVQLTPTAQPAGASTRHMAKAPVAELDKERNRPKQMALLSEHDKPNMSKLMGHGYIKEWQHERDSWFDKQQKVKEQFDDITLQRQTLNLRLHDDATTATDGLAAGDAPEAPARQNDTSAEKEPFKLSKFKNVPARTDSHAPTAYQPKSKVSGDQEAE